MDTQFRQPNFNGDHTELVRLLKKIFSSLCLLADRNDRLSLESLITHARHELKNYKRWQESGAPISGLVVRLTDSEEVCINKPNSRIMTIPCSRAELLPPPALKIYKKADKHFGEVLLYVVAANDVPPDGLTFRKTYPNKQALFLRIEHEEEQLKVSVNYTLAQEHALSTSLGWNNRILFVRPTLHSLLGLLYLMDAKLWRDKVIKYKLGWAAVISLVVAVGLLFATMNSDRGNPVRMATDVNTKANIRPALASVPIETTVIHKPNTSLVASSKDQRRPIYIDAATRPKFKPMVATGTTEIVGGRRASTTTLAFSGGQPIPIYIKAFVKDDPKLTTAIEESFVNALRKKSRFIVLTDADERDGIPPDVYWVDIWFSQKPGWTGTIQVALRTGPNQLAWVGERDCHEYPDGDLIKQASLELVADMVYELEEVQKGG